MAVLSSLCCLVVIVTCSRSSLGQEEKEAEILGVGRLMEPPSRGSMWRLGFFAPQDKDDAKSDCGGFTRMWKKNKGRCGVCGDAFDLPTPRPHEDGGQFGRGIVTRHYVTGQSFEVQVELLNNRRGHFELELCPDTDCLDVIVLNQTGSDSLESKFFVPQAKSPKEVYKLTYQLPENFTCDHCAIRWKYVMGSHVWPCSNDDRMDSACGPQLEARACADIAINEGITPNEEEDEEGNEKVDLLAGIFQLDELDEEENKSWIATLHTFKKLIELKSNGTHVAPNIIAHGTSANDKMKMAAAQDLEGADVASREESGTSGMSTKWNTPIPTQDNLITEGPFPKVESEGDGMSEIMTSNTTSAIGTRQSSNSTYPEGSTAEAEPETALEPDLEAGLEAENVSTIQPELVDSEVEKSFDPKNISSQVEPNHFESVNETKSAEQDDPMAETEPVEAQSDLNLPKAEPEADPEGDLQDRGLISEVDPSTKSDLSVEQKYVEPQHDEELSPVIDPETEPERPPMKAQSNLALSNKTGEMLEPKVEQEPGADAECQSSDPSLSKPKIKATPGLEIGSVAEPEPWKSMVDKAIEPETSLERSPVSSASELSSDTGSSSTTGSAKEPFLEIAIDNYVDNGSRHSTQLFPELVYHHYNDSSNGENGEPDGMSIDQRALIFPRDNEILSSTVVTKQLTFPKEKGISERTKEKRRKRKKKKMPPTKSDLTKKNDDGDENEFKHEKLTHAYSQAHPCCGIIRAQIIVGVMASLLVSWASNH